MSEQLSNVLHAWADLATRQSMENNRKFIHAQGYSFAQMNSLFFIYHNAHGTINQLSCHLGISKAAASQMIERLVDLGLVHREEDPDDRRSKRLTLTDAGMAFIQASKQARHAWIDQFCAMIDPLDAEPMIKALEGLVARMKQFKETLSDPTEK